MKENRPRVSIGMPVYNGDRFLTAALDAILAQTFTDFELIISDNDSTDKTQEICQIYAAKDKRIKYHRNEQNIGCHKNYNRVFELATGEYFKWAAHDDLFAPQLLERCVEILDHNPAVVLCYAKAKIIDDFGTILQQDCDESPRLTDLPQPPVRFRNLIIDSFAKPYRGLQLFGLVRSNALVQTPLLGDFSGADLALIARLSLVGQFFEVPEHLFFSRDHQQRSTKAMSNPYFRAGWFDPDKEGKLVFHKWNTFLGYLNAIKQTSLSLSEQIYCYFHLLTWLSKHGDKLLKEAIKAAIWPIYFSVKRRRMLLQQN